MRIPIRFRNQTRLPSLTSQAVLSDLLLLGIGVGWGYTFVITKYIIVTLPVLLFLGTRFLLAGLLLAIIIWPHWKRSLTRAEIKHGIIAGLFLAAAYSIQTFGILHTTPGKAGMITELTTILTPFLYFLVTRNPVARAAVLGTLLAFLGSVMMEWQGTSFGFNVGDALVLLCDFAYAAHLLVVDRTVERLNVWWYIAVQLITVGLVCLALGLTTESFPSHMSSFQWFGYVYELIVGTLLAYLVQIFAQSLSNPTHVVVLLSFEGPFALFFSWLQWGEAMTAVKGLGALVIFAGVLITELYGSRDRDKHTVAAMAEHVEA